MSSSVTLKAIGLNIQPNQLDVPPGSLSEASNVIIRRDNVVESRRGYKLYGNAMGTGSDRAKQLMTYKQRILRHFSNQLEYDDGSGTFTAFSGTFLEPQTGRRIRFIESNGNFYFTTDEGIQKISAKTAADFTSASGFVTQAGGIKAVDVTARLNIVLGNQSGFLPQDSAVAYRIVWGSTDANNNLILGAPSQRVEIFNPLIQLELQDFDRLLEALDNVGNAGGSLITDTDYISTLRLAITASASELYVALTSLVTKLDSDILYASTAGSTPIKIGGVGSIIAVTSNVATITQDTAFTQNFSSYLTSGSNIFLSGFTGGAAVLNGPQVIATAGTQTATFNFTTANFSQTPITSGQIFSYEYASITPPTVPTIPTTNDQLVSLQTYLQNIIVQLQSEPSTGTPPTISSASQTTFISPLDITTTATVILNITIPQDVTVNNFYQIYRSDIAQATGTQVLNTDIAPNDELKLVFEGFPTSADISAGFVEVEDITPEEFRGAFLYTNSTTGEGILQANDIPPFALDINRFKNVTFYANTRTRFRESISLLGVVNIVNDFNTAIITKTFTSADVNTGTETITIASHGFLNGQNVIFTNPVLGNLPGGLFQNSIYFIIAATTNTFKVSTTLGGSAVNLTSGGTGTHTVESHVIPKLTITNGTITNTYTFVTGLQETTRVATVADVANSLAGTYFTLNSANDFKEYYVWYRVSGTGTDPAVSGREGIVIDIATGDSANTVASKTSAGISSYNAYFNTSVSTNLVVITNIDVGNTTDATAATSGFTITVLQQGRGEDHTINQVLLSTSASPAIAVDETARSLVHIINQNSSDSIYAFYLSGAQDVPGKILFESRSLGLSPFYILANNSIIGASFNPDVSPAINISSISVANPTVITTSTPHGLINQDQVVISGSNSTPSVDGLYSISYINSTSFTINVNVTIAGNTGALRNATTTVTADNEILANRIYYSKILQPEAVPIVNTIDVGAKDKAILRIFPLRDSLFVFKEDGLFRISGETAPFNLALFDGSAILLAPDSLDISNNLLYGWSTQGVVAASESGVNIISRAIDIDILKLATSQYTNFKTATWGIGYESDNSYTVYTVTQTSDTLATIGYRYSTLTNSWTTFDKTDTCGVINSVDDRQYLGAGDTDFLEQERKDFSRLDYADREVVQQLTFGNYFGNIVQLPNVTDVNIGDVITQDQMLTVYGFNVWLEKLDLDALLSPHDYLSTQEMSAGDDPRTKLDDLITKIANDPGRLSQPGFTPAADYLAYKSIAGTSTINSISASNPTVIQTSAAHNLQTGRIITISGSDSTPSVNGDYQVTVLTSTTFTIPVSVTIAGTTGSLTVQNNDFDDIQASYNGVIDLLNNDAGVAFGNYSEIVNTTLQEAIILAVDKNTKRVTLNLTLDFIVGPLTIYETITSAVQWAQMTFGDPLNLKHVREATLMFENKAFTNATLSFSSDLLPEFIPVPFMGTGNGIFGHNDFGYNFFGGASHSAPFRTYVPRNVQRCRYINCRFEHIGAREQYAIFGITLTGEIGQSSRAYR